MGWLCLRDAVCETPNARFMGFSTQHKLSPRDPVRRRKDASPWCFPFD